MHISDDLNLYAYVGNDPLDKTDPSGNAPPEELEESKEKIAESEPSNVVARSLLKELNEISPGHGEMYAPGYVHTADDLKDLENQIAVAKAARASDIASGTSNRERYSGRYEDGQKAYRTNVPRDAQNNHEPLPDADGAHSRLQPDAKDPSKTYSATEFDQNGQAVKRVDFAGRKGEVIPHEHPYDPATKAFGDKRPLSGN